MGRELLVPSPPTARQRTAAPKPRQCRSNFLASRPFGADDITIAKSIPGCTPAPSPLSHLALGQALSPACPGDCLETPPPPRETGMGETGHPGGPELLPACVVAAPGVTRHPQDAGALLLHGEPDLNGLKALPFSPGHRAILGPCSPDLPIEPLFLSSHVPCTLSCWASTSKPEPRAPHEPVNDTTGQGSFWTSSLAGRALWLPCMEPVWRVSITDGSFSPTRPAQTIHQAKTLR